ncbi:hypothetical protein [Saccharopolyspora cebuensis]|uniref:Uncharacterized protein n=1 Tax=Saccharopolyspora cebuensis TaxID=418759 RepID=A0ABV4CL61_9PSEU
METCPKCGRLKDSEGCGYCWGLAAGMAYHQAQYEREHGIERGRTRSGAGCSLVLLAATALPVLGVAAELLTT